MTDTAVSPNPGAPYALDERSANIQAYWNAYHDKPQMIFDGMAQYGVSAAELGAVTNINVEHYLRANHAPDGLGGIKEWSPTAIHQFEGYYGLSTAPANDIWVQDVLDRALNREHLYESVGLLGVADIAAIAHPWVMTLA